MPIIKEIKGISPQFGERCFIADNAVILGDVTLGDDCSVWYNTVIRGDVHFIRIGHSVNIQDGAVLHCTYKKSPVRIGDEVSIGHNALVHGCTLEDRVLIGMGAIVMDDVIVRTGTLVAAGAVVPPKRILESGYIYAGNPARKLKALNQEDFNFFITRTAENYKMYAGWHK